MKRAIANKTLVLKAYSTDSVILSSIIKLMLLVLIAFAIFRAHENILWAFFITTGGLVALFLLSTDKLLYITNDSIILQKKYLAVFNKSRRMYFKDMENIEIVGNYATKSEPATTMMMDPSLSNPDEVIIKYKSGAIEIIDMRRFKHKIQEFLSISKGQIALSEKK